jgi:hypothetical protein
VVVGSTTLRPGESTGVSARFTMPKGMGGPHLFLIRVRTNDAAAPERILRIKSDWVE